ncbi:MAG: hypothetical protein QF473_34275, partial [Planctomycetota bacterium]|nr:hypothetical protein [Planctomycetota bacterium]
MTTRLAIHAVTLSFLTFSLSFAEDTTAAASPAELLKAGDDAFAKKEFSVAADKYSAFLDKNAKDKQAPSVHLKLSDALIAAGLPLRASTNYEALLREHADTKEAIKGRFLLGKTHEARG